MNLQEYIKLRKLKNLKYNLKNYAQNQKTLCIITDAEYPECETYMKSKKMIGADMYVNTDVAVVANKAEIARALDYAKRFGWATILQLPCRPELVDYYKSKRPESDVDGFFTAGELYKGEDTILPATPKGIMDYLKDEEQLDLRGKTVVILGRGELVGKPLAVMMINEGATVAVFNSKSDLEAKRAMLALADVVILATGVKGSAKLSEINKDAIIFNVGTIFDNVGKLTTELEVDCELGARYTPRIKGVGPLTCIALFENVMKKLGGNKNVLKTKVYGRQFGELDK